MSSSLFGIGVTGLNAAQAGIITTGHNISNVATPGYSRQENLQSTTPALAKGNGQIGTGVQVDTVRRIYNDFLAHQVQLARAQGTELETNYAQVSRLDTILSDDSAGLASALQDFFGAVHGMAANPASMAPRQALLESAEALVTRFSLIEQRLADETRGVNSQISTSVATINSYAEQIARLNGAIVVAQSGGSAHAPNDLLDQRDMLVTDLNREIKATVLKQDDGSYNVFVGNGQPLVMSQQAYGLRVVPSAQDPERIVVAYTANGVTQPLAETTLTGGHLGGLLAFRRETLDSARNALGQTAVVLAGTLNDQHRLGLDARGEWGGDLFNIGSPAALASQLNSGNAAIAASFSGDYAALTASDYRLRFDAGAYTLTRLTDGQAWSFTDFPQSVDGFTLNLASGTAQAGDDFLIRPVAGATNSIAIAITDPARLAAAGPVATAAALSNTGTGKIGTASVPGPAPAHTDVLLPVTIRFTGAATFDVVRTDTGAAIASGVPYTPGAPVAYNGWTVQITGQPAAGDAFNIRQSEGAGDNRNALLLAGLQSASTVNGTSSYQSSYAQLVSQIGGKARQLAVTSKAQANLEADAVRAQQSVSGVNLDEEAAKLLRYQQAYQASGKVIQTASMLFASLLEIMR